MRILQAIRSPIRPRLGRRQGQPKKCLWISWKRIWAKRNSRGVRRTTVLIPEEGRGKRVLPQPQYAPICRSLWSLRKKRWKNRGVKDYHRRERGQFRKCLTEKLPHNEREKHQNEIKELENGLLEGVLLMLPRQLVEKLLDEWEHPVQKSRHPLLLVSQEERGLQYKDPKGLNMINNVFKVRHLDEKLVGV